MHRRGFFLRLATLVAVGPLARFAPSAYEPISLETVSSICATLESTIMDNYFKASPMVEYLRQKGVDV